MISITIENGESLRIGDDIIVTIIDIKHGKTTLAVQAPNEKYLAERELTLPPAANIPLPEVCFLD